MKVGILGLVVLAFTVTMAIVACTSTPVDTASVGQASTVGIPPLGGVAVSPDDKLVAGAAELVFEATGAHPDECWGGTCWSQCCMGGMLCCRWGATTCPDELDQHCWVP